MNIVMLSKIQEHMRRGAQFFTISTMQKTQKKKTWRSVNKVVFDD